MLVQPLAPLSTDGPPSLGWSWEMLSKTFSSWLPALGQLLFP